MIQLPDMIFIKDDAVRSFIHSYIRDKEYLIDKQGSFVGENLNLNEILVYTRMVCGIPTDEILVTWEQTGWGYRDMKIVPTIVYSVHRNVV